MKKLFVAALLALSFTNVFASENTDLVLENERWFGKWTAYICEDGYTQASEAPAELEEYQVEFGHVGTTFNLDKYLIKATFVENGVTCSYSSFLFADKQAWTIELLESKAFAVEGQGSCAAGKAVIDEALAFNDYKYLHGRAAIYPTFSNAGAACANDATGRIGIHFQVQGRRNNVR